MSSINKDTDSAPSQSIGLIDASSIMIGVIIGVGVFESSPIIAASLPNNESVLGFWVIGALLSVIGGMCFAELSTTYPKEGGAYQYLNRSFGRPVGFLFAWASMLVSRPGMIVAMAFPFASYFYAAFPIGEEVLSPKAAKLTLAITSIVILSIINIIGVKASTRTQNLLTLVKILGITLVLFLPFFHSGEPAIKQEVSNSANYGLALILVLFAFGGWSEVTLFASEVRNPQKNLSRSIFLAIAIVAILYISLNAVFLEILGLGGLSTSQAAATDAVNAVGFGGNFISALICLCALGAVNGTIMAGARVSYVLGEDHPCFKFLSGWSDKTGTPVKALSVQCILCVLVALITGSFDKAVIYATAVVWLFYLLCGIAVILLRIKEKNRERPYKVPFYPVVPIAFCASCVYLIYSAFDYDTKGSLIAFGLTILGLVFYRPKK